MIGPAVGISFSNLLGESLLARTRLLRRCSGRICLLKRLDRFQRPVPRPPGSRSAACNNRTVPPAPAALAGWRVWLTRSLTIVLSAVISCESSSIAALLRGGRFQKLPAVARHRRVIGADAATCRGRRQRPAIATAAVAGAAGGCAADVRCPCPAVISTISRRRKPQPSARWIRARVQDDRVGAHRALHLRQGLGHRRRFERLKVHKSILPR